jgi:hypothetical protein
LETLVSPKYLIRVDLSGVATLVALENLAKDAQFALETLVALNTFPKLINWQLSDLG